MLTKRVLFVPGKPIQVLEYGLPDASECPEGTFAFVPNRSGPNGTVTDDPRWKRPTTGNPFTSRDLNAMVWETVDKDAVPNEYKAAILLLT